MGESSSTMFVQDRVASTSRRFLVTPHMDTRPSPQTSRNTAVGIDRSQVGPRVSVVRANSTRHPSDGPSTAMTAPPVGVDLEKWKQIFL